MSQVSLQDREKIMDVISDKQSRKDFKANSKKALSDAGVTDSPEVDQLRTTLDGLKEDELDVIAKLNKEMVKQGLTEGGSTILGRAV